MKLYFLIKNFGQIVRDFQNTGVDTNFDNVRLASIELTEEQMKKLNMSSDEIVDKIYKSN